MRLSRYFLPTLREDPVEASIVSHRLMLRAGLIRQSSAGIYNWLPLGVRVLSKITAIVREEQDRIGAHECLLPTIQPAELWQRSGRYEGYGKEMLRLSDRHGRALLYGPTNEEAITDLFAETTKSHKDLPLRMYHIQWKFRDEIRPRFGVMRAREFLMKDAYSFDEDDSAGIASYNAMFVSYMRIFARLGLQAVPMRAETGPIGGENSHEFVILAETGESAVYCDSALLAKPIGELTERASNEDMAEWVAEATAHYAATDDMHNAEAFATQVPSTRRYEARGIEVGHVFFFGDKYSRPLGARATNAQGETHPVVMGSYGVGISRLVGAIVEASHDERGIIWPDAVAPFSVGLLCISQNSERRDLGDSLYRSLCEAGIETLYDDRPVRPGVKFADMDLLGLPCQVLVGDTLAKQRQVEVKTRRSSEVQAVSQQHLIEAMQRRFPSAKNRRAHAAIFD